MSPSVDSMADRGRGSYPGFTGGGAGAVVPRVVDVVRRVGPEQVGLAAAENLAQVLGVGGIAAEDAVGAEPDQLTGLGDATQEGMRMCIHPWNHIFLFCQVGIALCACSVRK